MKFDHGTLTATVDEHEIHEMFCCGGPFEVPDEERAILCEEDVLEQECGCNWEIHAIVFSPTSEFHISEESRLVWETRINRVLTEIHEINSDWHEAFDCT